MNTVVDIKVKTWSPAVPCKIPDNIVSSQFASKKVFVPSYEKEKRPCIEQLLTNEYQRMWWQEKEAWDKRYSRKIGSKQLLQRMIIRKKSSAPIVEKSKKIKKLRKKKETKATETVEKPKENHQAEKEVPKQKEEKEVPKQKEEKLCQQEENAPQQSTEKPQRDEYEETCC